MNMKKHFKKHQTEESIRNAWDIVKRSSAHMYRVPKNEERGMEKGRRERNNVWTENGWQYTPWKH